MHELINSEVAKSYEPSAECKERWLYTRKKKLEFEEVLLNGFYYTAKFKRDKMLLLLVVGLELYGVYALWTVLPNPLLSLIAFPLDAALATVAHLLKKPLLIAKTKRALAHYGEVSYTQGKTHIYEKEKQSTNIFWFKAYEFFWCSLICILAIVKTLLIFSYASVVDMVKIVFFVMYAVTAVIHVTTTGYVFAEWFFRAKVKKEKKELSHVRSEDLNKNNQAITTPRLYELHQAYNETAVHMQKITLKPDSADKSIFSNWGILQDNELLNLIEPQETIELKKSLAVRLLYCQLAMLKEEANRNNLIQPIDDDIKKITQSSN